MRLINTHKFIQEGHVHFEEFYDGEIPDYAILSHTWERNQEVTYQNCNSDESKAKSGFVKIGKTCELAIQHGFGFAWVDTCCIDKSSSAELTEAINSMFRWYQRAGLCFANLSDLESGGSLSECRWFTRGWTLQELIAPNHMLFFNKHWRAIGDKKTLSGQLSSITKVPPQILAHDDQLSSICVARRLSWAAGRKTTRTEDIAYCLLGLFDINMPMLYGEGGKAFYRLQEEIVKTIYDFSILAWSPPRSMKADFCGVFANSPDDFASCLYVQRLEGWTLAEEDQMTVTSKGLAVRKQKDIADWGNGRYQYVLSLGCRNPGTSIYLSLAISLRKIGPTTFIRSRHIWHQNSFEPENMANPVEQGYDTFTLITKLPDTCTSTFLSRDRYPNIVSSNRSTTVTISSTLFKPTEIPLPAPLKLWDIEDGVFFATPGSLENWAAQMIHNGLIFVCAWRKRGGTWDFQGWLLSLEGKTLEEGESIYNELFHLANQFNHGMAYISRVVKGLGVTDTTRALARQGDELFEHSFTVECERDRPEGGTHWTVRISQKKIE